MSQQVVFNLEPGVEAQIESHLNEINSKLTELKEAIAKLNSLKINFTHKIIETSEAECYRQLKTGTYHFNLSYRAFNHVFNF